MDKLSKILKQRFEDKARIVAPLVGFPGLQLKSGSIKLAQQNHVFHMEVIKANYEEFKPDIIFPLMDLSLEANALGCFTKFPLHESATVPAPQSDVIDLEQLNKVDIAADSRVISYINTVELMVKDLPEDVLKGAYIIGPFTLAALIKGADSTAMATMLNPTELEELIELCIEKISRFMNILIDKGVDIICILEPTASLLGPHLFNQFSGKYISKLIEICKAKNTISALHICGNTMAILDKMVATKAHVLSLDSNATGVNLLDVLKRVPETVCIMGNINPTGAILNEGAPAVKAEVTQLMQETVGYPNFILSTGCDLPLETPIENIKAFMSAGRNN